MHNLIDNYRHLFAQIDIRQLNIKQEMFDRSFKNICRKLFNTRPTDKSYIIALLGFALTLHEYHQSYHCSWYHVDMLINSLVDVLEDINFQPKNFLKNLLIVLYCELLFDKRLIRQNTFLFISPVVSKERKAQR